MGAVQVEHGRGLAEWKFGSMRWVWARPHLALGPGFLVGAGLMWPSRPRALCLSSRAGFGETTQGLLSIRGLSDYTLPLATYPVI